MKLACRILVSLAVFSSVLMTAAPAHAALPPSLVQDDPARGEYAPAATGLFVAWSDATVRQVYARPRAGGSTFQVSSAVGYGFNSSPVTGGTDQIIYQQTNTVRTRANLYIYNLATKLASKLPTKVDSPYWEWAGVASTHYVFFNRRVGRWDYMLLYNRSSGRLSQIARFTAKCFFCYTPTWVGATHAVYDRCPARTGACRPQVMTIGGATVGVPVDPAPVTAYGGSLDEASGNLYFIKSSVYCGIFVSIERANIATLGTQTDLYDTASGFDLESTSLAPNANGTDIDLLFTDYDCMGLDSGTFEIARVNLL